MIFIDTSFVVAWVNPNDFLHHKALSLLDQFRTDQWLTTDSVLLEIGNSFSRKHKNKGADVIDLLLSDDNTTISAWMPSYLGELFNCIKRGKTRLGG